MAQLVGHSPINQKVTSLIPSPGTCLGCGFGPWSAVCRRQPIDVSHIDVSLPLFHPPFTSLAKKIYIQGQDLTKLIVFMLHQEKSLTLAVWLSSLEHCPIHEKVAGLILVRAHT